MSIVDRWPQTGDMAVELRHSRRPGVRDTAGPVLTVKNVAADLVRTSDGERYVRRTLRPFSEGRFSDRQLVPATDPRVLTVRGREHLDAVARVAANLARIDRRTPLECVEALNAIIVAVRTSRNALAALMADAARQEQESNR